MKVYSLYHHNKFVASFTTREEAISYGKECGGDPWDYDIIEEYLSKTPYNIYPLTPSQPIPYTHPPVISKPPARYPDTFPQIYCDGSSLKSSCSDGPQTNLCGEFP
jgi:hypothetical protein